MTDSNSVQALPSSRGFGRRKSIRMIFKYLFVLRPLRTHPPQQTPANKTAKISALIRKEHCSALRSSRQFPYSSLAIINGENNWLATRRQAFGQRKEMQSKQRRRCTKAVQQSRTGSDRQASWSQRLLQKSFALLAFAILSSIPQQASVYVVLGPRPIQAKTLWEIPSHHFQKPQGLHIPQPNRPIIVAEVSGSAYFVFEWHEQKWYGWSCHV